MNKKTILSASLLAANQAAIGHCAKDAILAGVDWLHFDIMDNHYVPNLSFGPQLCRILRQMGILVPFDVHLMAKPVDNLIVQMAEAGATYISIHPETTAHLDRSIDLIKKYGCKAGIVLNPATALSHIELVIDQIDILTILLVNPGFHGQAVIPYTLKKIKLAKDYIEQKGLSVLISVDGGVNSDNAKEIVKLGADVLVAGKAVFGLNNIPKNVKKMRDALVTEVKLFEKN